MYPSFDGEVRNGRLVIDELANRGERLLEGKDVAVVVLDDEQRRGTVAAGRYAGGMLDGAEGKDALRGYEGRQAVVIVRHPMLDGSGPDAFDQKFQLGSKIGDLDT